MKKQYVPSEALPRIAAAGQSSPSLFKSAFLKVLRHLRHGQLTIIDGDDRQTFGTTTPEFPVAATIRMHTPGVYRRLLTGGSIGAGEAYMDGEWSTDDLTNVVRIFVVNRHVLADLDGPATRIAGAFLKVWHLLRRNTPFGSRKNIAAHYDIGNDFFELFLDETMTYSAGFFASDKTTMKEASLAKYDRLCRKLDLKPGEHVLEIGTGWGGFAIHAARHYGVRVTTTTISRNQYEYAERRIKAAGLSSRITLLCADYRNLTGQYDKLASIEMIEAVGWQFYETYFRQCAHLLKDNGLMGIQAITIRDQYYEKARQSVDFIQRHIFPGATIPSTTALLNAATRASDLQLVHLEDNTPGYARTLAEWRAEMVRNHDLILARGYPERMVRMWEFYLCYCEGGFAERSIQSMQAVFAKPMNRTPSLLPALA